MGFKRNPRLVADLKREQGQQIRDAVRQVAEPARARADEMARQAHAPWMPKTSRADQVVVTEIAGSRVRIVLRGFGAHLIEFGSRNNPVWAPLRRGVRAAGLRLVEHDDATD